MRVSPNHPLHHRDKTDCIRRTRELEHRPTCCGSLSHLTRRAGKDAWELCAAVVLKLRHSFGDWEVQGQGADRFSSWSSTRCQMVICSSTTDHKRK
ncbi:uncharacterized protein LOC144612777 isoform X2 [Panthera onca]